MNSIPLPPGLSDVTVLIADTDRRTTAAIQRPLEGGGYAVLVTRTGRQTIQAIYDQQPDLVLLGSRLHEANGQWVCQQIKADAALGFLPIILLSDRQQELEQRNGSSDLLPDAVLTKPVNSAELAMWVQIMLRLKAQFDRRLARLAREAKRLEMLRSDIISNISHELGTPLLQVKSAIALLTEDVAQHGSSDQVKLSDMATQAVARLEGEVNNIRQLARTHDIRLAPTAFSEATNLAIRHLQRSWTSQRGVNRVETHIPDGLPLVLSDKRALGRLLQVLIDNALKFSLVTEPVYVIGEWLDDDRVWVGVRDFGIGIAADQHSRIFEAFYKVDGSTTARHGGSGTGLALALLLATGMNTTITVESAPGKGSTFSFVLPVADLDGDY
ncbi:MAG: response regulator [Anaerolineae bacterium]|nr:response regulator [Anaerolineae bacterium]